MKRMLNLLGNISWTCFRTGCDHTTVGYLDAKCGLSVPDTVYFKAVLNPEDPEEARRIQFEIPGKPLLLKERGVADFLSNKKYCL